ncbi:ABC transporter substrate-binding protein [Helicobacter sp. CLO-3]|uniref:transporter substrate-binding domain-containing protein n=1 Tax=unclassified Helicobacter TaxID=2593540 RepID=UPI00080582F9|nr:MULTISPECIES: transporter substrate-binding domain-containing protein [unclassified Helicobacter]OBV29405.1 ABC transporter substrate-binding protein [Helicobacter sp. CLO-3]OHU82360.1 ABC transporter substrate-binding protein [Helicobacter sp. CLO-3]
MIAGFFVACEKRGVSLDDIAKRDELVVGVFGDKPPFGYIDAKGQNAGFDVYIARRMGSDMLKDKAVFGDKVRFVIVEAANRIEFLRSNKVDVMMANFTMTKERQEQVDFSLPYMKVALGVVSKDGAIRDVSELSGKTLIVNKGTTADFYFTKNHPEIKLLKFEQNTETFAALKDGRGDALAHDNTLLFAWAKENPAFKVGIKKLGDDDVIAAAVKKGNKELLEWINTWMDMARQEGFFIEAYEKTLANAFGDDVRAQDVVFVK